MQQGLGDFFQTQQRLSYTRKCSTTITHAPLSGPLLDGVRRTTLDGVVWVAGLGGVNGIGWVVEAEEGGRGKR